MIGKLITGFAWRHEQAIYFGPNGWGRFSGNPQIYGNSCQNFQGLINLFFILYLNIGRFLSTKTSEIRNQRRIQNAFRSTNKSKFSRGRSPNPPYEKGGNSLSCSPPLVPSVLFSPDHFLKRGDGPACSHEYSE